jgi:uncharacterized protein YcfL
MKKIIALFTAILLCACAAAPYSSNNPKVRMAVEGIESTVLKESSVNGVPKINVSVISTRMVEQKIRYRVVWFDADHGEISSSVSNWRSRSLQAKEPFDFSAVGPSNAAVRYLIDFEKQ